MAGAVTLLHGDSRQLVAELPDASIDAVVTDPPYALVSIVKRFGSPSAQPARKPLYSRASAGFMGQRWDTGETAFDPAFWTEVRRALKPGGYVLAFFHTQEAGPDAPCYRYHVLGNDILEMQHVEARKEVRKGPSGAAHTAINGGFRLQRVFNNRHIENLFRDFASIKFFLTRDNVREVLVVR